MGSLETAPEVSTVPPIPKPTKLVQLRTGKLKPLGELSILSGIDKAERFDRVRVAKLGLTDDEHDLTFHGGIDKAVHQYCSEHYPLWREMYPTPEVAERFVPGGFGENLIADGWNESNVCIGDQVRIGWPDSATSAGDDGVLLEVSLPRQPCFKLNQRFGIKNFAGKTHQLNRTGWYYRVVQEGWVENGMELRVVERRHPKWSIAKIHHHVHRDLGNREAIEEAVAIEEMGNEAKGAFKQQAKKLAQEEEERKFGKKKKPAEVWNEYKLVERRAETPRVVSITLESIDKINEKINVDAGSHVRIKLANGLSRSYSVVGGTNEQFELGIARDENSRGGSTYIHDTLKVGDIISVGTFTPSVPKVGSASHHIIIVGGIGITAFLMLMQIFHEINYNFELHYAVRSADEVAFRKLLDPMWERVKIYDRSKGERMDIPSIIKNRKWNSQVYVCGPQRMNDEVTLVAKGQGMDESEVHSEAFSAVTSGDPFTAEVFGDGKEAGKKLEVGEEQTLLQVLRDAGFEVQSSCEVGNCGTCKLGVKNGVVEHRGGGLPEDEKDTAMLSCVSRGKGHIVVELPKDD